MGRMQPLSQYAYSGLGPGGAGLGGGVLSGQCPAVLVRRAGPGHGPGCAGNRVDRFGTAGGYFDT